MSIFTSFNQTEDVISDDLEIVTQPVWSENLNPLSQSSAGVGFFTSSAQSASSGDYFVSVFQRDPVTDAETSELQFAIAYGNRLGSGSLGDPTIIGGNSNDTPSRAIYSQYKNILLPPNDDGFTFGSVTPDDAYFITVARARYKERLDPGNWELHISGATNPLKLIDDSGEGLNPPVQGGSGQVFNIISGSGLVTASDATVYGLFYPDLGIFVLNARALDASASLATNTGSVQAGNHFKLFNHISASSYFAARNEQEIKSNCYFVRIKSREFNYSNNPTFVTGSLGILRFEDMKKDPKVYITTVGLYNDNRELVAVAKLSKPLLKTFSREALIKVKLSY